MTPESRSFGDPLDTSPDRDRRESARSSTTHLNSSLSGPRESRSLQLSSQEYQEPRETPPFLANSGRKRKKSQMGMAEDGSAHKSPSRASDSQRIDLAGSPETPEKAQSTVRHTDSTSSVSPSLLLYRGHPVTKHLESQTSSTSVVDLTTPDRVASRSYPTPTSGQVLTAKPQPPSTPTAALDAGIPRYDTVETHARQWLKEVRPRQTLQLPAAAALTKFTTHVTPFLANAVRSIVQMVDFRPASVARDVKFWERGYWQFWIRVAEVSVVEEDRRPPKPVLKLLGSTTRRHVRATSEKGTWSAKDPSPALWTEDELADTWTRLEQAIEPGKAGTETWIRKTSEDGTLWKIQLFTWGEILAHSWLLLLILSSKLTGGTPMNWIAADGRAIVTMLPGKNLAGVWERKGEKGWNGAWRYTPRGR